ncbi:MAG: hypothetical protein ACJAVK_001638 [Akkermansiaceae bacterium]|jgi:hypothetical protein
MKNLLGHIQCYFVTFIAALGSCEQRREKADAQDSVNQSEAMRSDDYEFALAEALRPQKEDEPKLEVEVDLGVRNWFGEISTRKRNEQGFRGESGYFQGNIDLTLKLASGQELRKRCSHASIDRDQKGISRVQFEVYQRLSRGEAKAHLFEQWEIFQAIGMRKEVFEKERARVLKWLERDDDGGSSSLGIVHDGDEVKVTLRFHQFFDRTSETSLRYTFEPRRIGEATWEGKLKK